ncbi:MAG TPA: GH3 auxin-responsive promoter family protein [Balneolales bacterium]|nr:GH3 auxin-responsive promoter family protein [Balneolales bacterium]
MIDIKNQQIRVLKRNLTLAKDTYIGKKYRFNTINSYSSFKHQVPFHSYYDLQEYIEKIKNKHSDILWPGKIQNFAVSSGTTGEGKHLPLSDDRLKSDYHFMRHIVVTYLKQKPTLAIFGPQLSLPGSLEYNRNKNIFIGEISAFLAKMVPFYLRHFQVISLDELACTSWEDKFNRCLHAALNKDIRVINAVPSWTLILFQKALEITGKNSISEVWPNLQLITGGGVSLDSYKESLVKLCGAITPDFMEFYGASEGYFAHSETMNSDDLKLIINNGIFYEWYPFDKWKSAPDNDHIVPTWEIEAHTPYVITITNNSGLWRYPMNDIIEFTDVSKLKIKIIGRVSDMLDDYGEALYYQEGRQALSESTKEIGAKFEQFFMAATLDNQYQQPHHLWFIKWETRPNNPQNLAEIIDDKLRVKNRHYAIRRESEALGLPEMFSINNEIMETWLHNTPDATAQTKIPHIIHDPKSVARLREIIDRLSHKS